ncbi:choice-of-anchor D domain-containing protein [Candidatus Sulfurimonas baltica]|uniref:Choice-of-anchor D domain-containing protein n=1 Tax=Candidatus Sulfurimonas baltica TaxID=2740404 RepID=A0A7S7LX58_9BACT|nr:choice-of-anchor D domain-containing protein [Candidatus Sulfurimonas baltica]QOY53015.1 choice-of-anchor D domain-containing protein [Candidatus Sulfurimonas baltica]
MHNKSTTIKLISLSTLLLFTGCVAPKPQVTQTQATPKVSKVSPKTPQELSINSISKKTELKEPEKADYSINLNNTTNSNADIILKNKGEMPLTINSIKLITSQPSLFKLDSNCPSIINGKADCKLNLQFLGNNIGRFDAKIAIDSDDTKKKIKDISVTAEAVNKFSGVVTKIDSETTKVERIIKLNFNSANKLQYIKVKNNGIETLSLGQPSIKGPDKNSFSIEKNSCGNTLKVKESCEITVGYKATKDGFSDATIDLPSNGDITPSKYVRLEGFSKPFSITLDNFVVSKNVKDFLNDYFASKNSFYYRTIFQQKTDRAFESAVDSEIKKYFTNNSYRIQSNPDDADKILTIYPSVEVVKDSAQNTITYKIVVNGYITTKSNYDRNTKTGDKMILDNNSSSTEFTSIAFNNLLLDKEAFEFGMTIHADNVGDDQELAAIVADMMTSKLFNVIGLQDSKGNN